MSRMEVVAWVLLVLSLAGNVAYGLARRRRDGRRVESAAASVAHEDLRVAPKGRRFNAEVCDGKHADLNVRLSSLDSYTRTEVGRIHDKIDMVERRMNDSLRVSMSEIREICRQLPGEVIALLRSTGQLKDHHDD